MGFIDVHSFLFNLKRAGGRLAKRLNNETTLHYFDERKPYVSVYIFKARMIVVTIFVVRNIDVA